MASKWGHIEHLAVKNNAGKLSAKVIGEMIGKSDEAVRGYAKRNGIRLQRRGDNCQTTKYPDAVVNECRELYEKGVSPKQIVHKLGIPMSAVRDFVYYKRW